jgi:hypothetical protein
MNNVIEATILKGKYKGEDILIPRILMIPNDMPFNFKRLQFPVRHAFAMSINKSQGQSLSVCGINLENPCFSLCNSTQHELSKSSPSNQQNYTFNGPWRGSSDSEKHIESVKGKCNHHLIIPRRIVDKNYIFRVKPPQVIHCSHRSTST